MPRSCANARAAGPSLRCHLQPPRGQRPARKKEIRRSGDRPGDGRQARRAGSAQSRQPSRPAAAGGAGHRPCRHSHLQAGPGRRGVRLHRETIGPGLFVPEVHRAADAARCRSKTGAPGTDYRDHRFRRHHRRGARDAAGGADRPAVAASDIPVLIMGESGTGKELIARAIHNTADDAASPPGPLNSPGSHESILEDELFGHVRGAFTGAQTWDRWDR